MKNDHDLPPPGSELSRELTEEQQDLVEKEGPPIRDVMSRNVVTMDPGESLWEAAETFRRLHVHAAAVCTKGRFIGLVTGTRYCGERRGQTPQSSPHPDQRGHADEIPSCSENEVIARALRLMVEHRLRWLPILNGAQQVVGLLSADQAAGLVSPRAAAAILHRLPPAH
jgi:CBS domain-containing protein